MPDSIIKADNISSLSGGGVGFPDGSISNPSMKFTNSNTTGLYRPSANQLGLVTNGVERLRIDNNGQVSSVIPGGSTLYNQFMCRAWVNFGYVNSSILIRSSGNVSGVTRNSTGDYTITFLTAMPDVNYVLVGTSNRNQIVVSLKRASDGSDEAPTTSSIRIVTYIAGNAILDAFDIMVAVFR